MPVTMPTVVQFPIIMIIGAICGLLGAAFVVMNTWTGMFRKSMITRNWLKPIEVALFAFVTATFFFWAPYVAQENCEPTANLNVDAAAIA